jgi:two-component system chemotaxis response regulator CheB
VKALTNLAQRLPSDFPAALVIVLHVGSHRSILPEILARAGPLPAAHARHDERVEPGRIYVAPPDHHLLLASERLQLNRGAKEHHSRPAIDPLFRSAALAYGPGAIGVVLTGRLDDGTAGLQAIKAYCGTAIVQDPDDAEAPDMPASARRFVKVDHCVALDALPNLLVTLTKRAPAAAHQRQLQWPAHEQAILLAEGDPMEHLVEIGTPSSFVCPDCHGALWEVAGAPPRRFRCHTGHAFTIRTLQDTLATTSDESLWSARRALQERLLLLREMKRSVDPETIPPATIEAAASQIEGQLHQLERLMQLAPDPLE